MNAMSRALQSAGVRLPSQSQRIWQFIKDNDKGFGLTSEAVAKAVNIPQSSVSSLLSEMSRRCMVVATPHKTKLARGRSVWYYRAKGATYEMLPAPKKDKPTTTVVVSQPKAPTTHAHGVDLDSLTLGQIKSLLADIQTLFGTR